MAGPGKGVDRGGGLELGARVLSCRLCVDGPLSDFPPRRVQTIFHDIHTPHNAHEQISGNDRVPRERGLKAAPAEWTSDGKYGLPGVFQAMEEGTSSSGSFPSQTPPTPLLLVYCFLTHSCIHI